MDPYFSVFNCHVNNALEISIAKYKEIFGESRFEKKIRPFLDKGIMSIFKTPPQRDTKFFVLYITDVVNGKRTA